MRKRKRKPRCIVIAGPNGAGKTTFARRYLPEDAGMVYFVNADLIAGGLSPLKPQLAAIAAARIVLREIDRLAAQRVDFAFETTLATRSYVSLVRKAQDAGYKVTLLFIWIDSPTTAVQRVAERVVKGGHNIPSEVIERRYHRGLFNLINLYIPICDTWMVVNNEGVTPEPIAEGRLNSENIIINQYIWSVINSQENRNGNK